MYGCDSWTLKKAEHWRIDASELWCWRRLLRVPWTARRSNQSILKEISPGCSLEGLMLRLKLQYFGHLMWRTHWERLKAGGEGDDGRWDGWMALPTRRTWVWVHHQLREESEKAGLKFNIQKLRLWHLIPLLHGKQMGKQWKQWQTLFTWTPKSLQIVTATMKLKDAWSLEEKLWQI